MKSKKKKVAIGMSGGVDSSVAAFLLKQQGYDVFGVFMKLWSMPGEKAENVCCSLNSYLDAKRMAQQLDIPIYTFNFETPFKEKVVNDFLEQYQQCVTPNPCVTCNKYIKFDLFLKKAKALNADFIATGHYVQNIKQKDGFFHLYKGKDMGKDQSYFLYNLKQEHLQHILFPVGHLTKPEVRKIAKKNNLKVYSKAESQEVCFVNEGRFEEFLKHFLKLKSGDILNIDDNKKLGNHKGLQLYTIGQRKGLGLGGGPFYVVKKDVNKNILFVTNNKNHPDLYSEKIHVENINWILEKEPKMPFEVEVKTRYRTDQIPAVLNKDTENNIIVQFKDKVKAVTAGQSAVFYLENEVIGGGIIK